METYIYSLDISTTNIGCSLWDSNGKLIEMKHLSLKINTDVPVEDRDLHKAKIFKNYLIEYKNRIKKELDGEIKHIIVEEPLGGSNNSNTVSLLFGFNGICRYILQEIFEIYPRKISVHESRKLFCPELVKTTIVKGKPKETLSFPEKYKKDKKQYIWEKVSKLEPQIEWAYKKTGKLQDFCFDISDSYCVGYSGIIKFDLIKNS
jgi:hypothetical protein